jgi:SAM-dependent methyltransferase
MPSFEADDPSPRSAGVVDDRRFTEVFTCPSCGGGLVAQDHVLACEACGRRYPVVGGIPRFVEHLGGGQAQVQEAFDYEHRRFHDSEHTLFGSQLVDQFLANVDLPAEFFRGRRCVDIGCGSGRWTYALAELGAEVVAVDLTSGGVESLYGELGDRPNVTIAQADIFALPFAPETFDFVMSWGVLHHTPSTKQAFDRIVPLVRPGGTLYVMIYDVDQGRTDRGTNIVRWLLRRVSPERRYKLCRYLIIEDNMERYNFLSKHMIVAYYDPETSPLKRETLQFGLYDAYSPRYNWLHSEDEVTGWFRSSGFSEVSVIDSPQGSVQVRGIREAQTSASA